MHGRRDSCIVRDVVIPAHTNQDFPPELGETLPPEFLDWLLDHTSAMEQKMGVQYLLIDGQETIVRMPVEGNTQNTGMLHGGASCLLAESASSLAACAYGWPDRLGFGATLFARYQRPVETGLVTAVARLHRVAARSLEYRVELFDDSERQVSDVTVKVQLARAPRSSKPAPSSNRLDR